LAFIDPLGGEAQSSRGDIFPSRNMSLHTVVDLLKGGRLVRLESFINKLVSNKSNYDGILRATTEAKRSSLTINWGLSWPNKN
jgi:hypothetical protein